MAYKIIMSGIVGREIVAEKIRTEFENAAGSPVLLEINSVGGSVVQGLEIRNIVASYGGHVTARIIIAASMVSDISTAADLVEVSADSIYMIHSASGLTAGNAKQHKKAISILKNLDRIMAGHYAGKSGKSVDEILTLMDAETWYYGNEIQKAGFADRMFAGKTARPKAAALSDAQYQFAACAANYHASAEDIQQAAALAAWDALYDHPVDSQIADDIAPEAKTEADKWASLWDKNDKEAI